MPKGDMDKYNNKANTTPENHADRARDCCYAHSTGTQDRSDWHLLSAHLQDSATRSAAFAARFGVADIGHVAALLHDVGKYSRAFQAYLRGGARVEHSTAGAKIAAERWRGPVGRLLAFCIAGHHGGLANALEAGTRRALADRLRGKFAQDIPEPQDLWQREISLPSTLQPPKLIVRSPDRVGFQYAFLVRMLFSCLVDADYLDTEDFYLRIEGREPQRGGFWSLRDLREPLADHLGKLRTDGEVNQLRAEVLSYVRGRASDEPGIFSLTVPTGGGKTLTSLAFALDHAIKYGLDRVIYVIPYTSIIEQTANVFRQALGAAGARSVVEHHSAYVDDPIQAPEAREKLRLAMENWDAPIVVTTAVQFFESLFAARPSQCRKLHRIARSVVILDEAQTLPLKILRPCVAALDELTLNYGASVVLCTATQPALAETADPQRTFRGGLRGVRELAPAPEQLYSRLQRVTVRDVGVLDDEELATQLRDQRQALCIVNNRKHARALYTKLHTEVGDVLHLSTLMCAKHRTVALASVRKALKDGQPCRLVATSLIEAGVDVDFPLVMRAEAGLESIAQAAGRCNREGRRPASESEVRIFRAPQWPAPTELRQFAQAAEEVLRRFPEDPLSLAAIESYFRLLYWRRDTDHDSGLDGKDLLGRMQRARFDVPFEDVAADFRFIDSQQVPVIIPYDGAARAALESLARAKFAGELARTLQPYVVQIPQRGVDRLRVVGAVQPVAEERFGDQFLTLIAESLYSDAVGLSWDDPTFADSEKLMW